MVVGLSNLRGIPKSFFLDENRANGLPEGTGGAVQAGVTDSDDGRFVEKDFTLPYATDPAVTYLLWECWPVTELDPGTALHKPLPQSARAADTLASGFVDDPAGLSNSTQGTNLDSQGNYTDVVQNMATSEYRFGIVGRAMRLGLPPTIPGVRFVRGKNQTRIPATPTWPQRVWGPRVVMNTGGVPVFYSTWELWYIVALPPAGQVTAPPDLAAHIRGDQQLPKDVLPPAGTPDQNSRKQKLSGFITGK